MRHGGKSKETKGEGSARKPTGKRNATKSSIIDAHVTATQGNGRLLSPMP